MGRNPPENGILQSARGDNQKEIKGSCDCYFTKKRSLCVGVTYTPSAMTIFRMQRVIACLIDLYRSAGGWCLQNAFCGISICWFGRVSFAPLDR